MLQLRPGDRKRERVARLNGNAAACECCCMGMLLNDFGPRNFNEGTSRLFNCFFLHQTTLGPQKEIM